MSEKSLTMMSGDAHGGQRDMRTRCAGLLRPEAPGEYNRIVWGVAAAANAVSEECSIADGPKPD